MTARIVIPALLGAVLFYAFSMPCWVHAEDLGAKAQTYRLDPDAREEFKDVIRHKKSTGELDQFWQNYRDKTIASIKNPAPLGIKSDYAQRSVFNPVRFTVPGDYRNERSEVVVRRGTVVEPLKLQPLTSGLAFIDGRDSAQIDYAIARGRLSPLKIVLTAGSPLDLRVKYQHTPWGTGQGIPFYFDQRRMIIDSLNRLYGIEITTVPVVLTQEGSGLRIESGLSTARPAP
jgi:conjugal transfer pilus assembly protein TraW